MNGDNPGTAPTCDASIAWLDNSGLYLGRNEAASLHKVDLQSGFMARLSEDASDGNDVFSDVEALTGDQEFIYATYRFNDGRGSQLVAAPKDPGTLTVLLETSDKGGAIAVDDEAVYWVVGDAIVRIEK